MAVTKEPAESLADTVKRDLRTPLTTTHTTLNILRSLLGLNLVDIKKPAAVLPAPKQARKAPAKAPAKPIARKPSANARPDFNVHDAVSTPTQPLPLDRRRALATETFNITLRQLSSEAKEKQNSRQPQLAATPRASPQKALQSRSPNRRTPTTSKEKAGSTNRIARATIDRIEPLQATADCAIVAVQCLDRLAQDAGSSSPEAGDSLIRGAQILLDKLTVLGLIAQTEQQVWQVRRQLCARFGQSTKSAVAKASLSSAIIFETILADAKTLNMISAFQLQVLKVGTLQGISFLDQTLVKSLDVSNPSGPVAICLKAIESGAMTEDKAGQYLHGFSMLLLRSCFAIRGNKESSFTTLEQFQLTMVALIIRCRSWKMLGHEPDTEKELWRPLSRALQAYSHICDNNHIADLGPINNSITALQELVEAAGQDKLLPNSVSNLLAEIAQQCGSTEDALAYLNHDLQNSTRSSGLASVINSCRAASIVLGDSVSDTVTRLASCEKALHSLKSSLKGTAMELRDLLLHTARLRKAATTAALNIEKLMQSAKVQEQDISLQTCSIRLLYAIARFVLQYVGQIKAPTKVLDTAKSSIDMHAAISSSVRNTVDSLLLVMKCKNVRSVLLWDETELALTRCLELISLVDESTASQSGKTLQEYASSSARLRLSNIYWAWYLHDKDAKLSTAQLCLLLNRSVDALEACSLEERHLGFEVVKYERLAACYQTLGDGQKSRNALSLAIKASIARGSLNQAVEIVLTQPSRLAWTDSKLDAHILGSCLRKLGRASISHDNQKAVDESLCFDDETLPEIHRAQVLELQLFAMAELPAATSSKAHCTSLAKQILGLCKHPQHHIYRIRFIRDLLSIASRHAQFPIHEILDDELIQAACTFQKSSSTTPCFLTSYGPLLCLSVLLQWAFLTTRPSAECIRGLVDSTALLLSQCPNSAELEAAVDEPDLLLRQLTAAADYAGMLDLVDIRLKALQAIRQILWDLPDTEPTRLAGCLTEIGNATARLGNTSDAGRAFAEAEKLLSRTPRHTETRLNWCLGYSDYLINLEAFEKGAQMIRAARSTYVELIEQLPNQERGNDRLKQDSFLSHAALAMSDLAFRQGNLLSAITYARQCVKLTSGLWAALEKFFDGVKDHLEATDIDLTYTCVEETANTTFSLDQSNLQTVIKGAPFWAHINIHFLALLHMSTLSAHCGLYPDAVYYASLAFKMSTLITSEQRQLACRVKLALLHARGGQQTEAKSLIKAIRPSSFNHLPDLEAGSFSLDLATAALSLDDLSASEKHLQRAGLLIAKVVLPAPSGAAVEPSAAVTIEQQMRTLTIADSKLIHGSKSRIVPTAQKNTTAPRNRSRKPVVPSKRSSPIPMNKAVTPVVARLQEAHTTLTLQVHLFKGEDFEQIESVSQTLALVELPGGGSRKLAYATLLLNRALALFGSDAVHCVLAETALAYPSKYSARRPSGRVSALSATTVSTKAKGVPTKTRQMPKQGIDNTSIDESNPESLLRKAYELLFSACATDIDRCSSDIVHDLQKLFCRLSMLANAVGLSLSYSPLKVVNDSLKPKDTMLLRERFVLDTDRPNADRSELRKWPTQPNSGIARGENSVEQVPALTTTFDDLPETWSVVSISLNDAKTEMLLSRVNAGATPLILRIPLARSSIDDTDENEFTFDEAEQELVDIITNANLTAHDSRSQGEKAARKVWWAEREALDHRLETLLLNMENIWLGGFRGIISHQHKSNEEMLSRFSSSLDAAMEKQLPSRQKTGGTSRHKVRLHAHILDLFIALGHPDENELDDAITDLLYFVVDILQFEGERNAYDEIDFDAILVDVLDALRSYHEACPAGATARHTILILDKELHAFPWESMPCLLGKSVSRMPSMGMIRDRLARIREQSADADAYTIPSTCGAYILNPSSDLPSTLATFAAPFTVQLPTFTSIVSRPPTETEFSSLLTSTPLLLYFGHGSGAQYIRGRRIRQLDRCAVTFLMGCSSGKMTECGVYESHGVPWNYMHGGAMAVVGALWDVTDRDIDRFAMRAFEEWGLLEGVGEEEGARRRNEARKKKGNQRKVNKDTGRKGRAEVALDEAVSRAREVCILRYLNGGAVVVYGLPVLLE